MTLTSGHLAKTGVARFSSINLLLPLQLSNTEWETRRLCFCLTPSSFLWLPLASGHRHCAVLRVTFASFISSTFFAGILVNSLAYLVCISVDSRTLVLFFWLQSVWSPVDTQAASGWVTPSGGLSAPLMCCHLFFLNHIFTFWHHRYFMLNLWFLCSKLRTNQRSEAFPPPNERADRSYDLTSTCPHRLEWHASTLSWWAELGGVCVCVCRSDVSIISLPLLIKARFLHGSKSPGSAHLSANFPENTLQPSQWWSKGWVTTLIWMLCVFSPHLGCKQFTAESSYSPPPPKIYQAMGFSKCMKLGLLGIRKP